MARKRTIDPAIWDSTQVMSLDTVGFKLYIYLLSTADDAGRVKLKCDLIKERLFKNSDVTEDGIRARIEMMSSGLDPLIVCYSVDGFDYCWHPHYDRYQKIRFPSESILPPPPSTGKQEVDPAVAAVWSIFHSVRPKIIDGRRETEACLEMFEKAQFMEPDDPLSFLIKICSTFLKLKKGNDAFWQRQPPLPSSLNVPGIWDRVSEVLRLEEEKKSKRGEVKDDGSQTMEEVQPKIDEFRKKVGLQPSPGTP